jgi:hypothetical protein
VTRALALFFRLKAEATKSRGVDDALTRGLPNSNVSGYRVPPSNIVVTAVDGEARGVGRTSRSISCGERRERGVSGQAEPFAIENRKHAPEFVPPPCVFNDVRDGSAMYSRSDTQVASAGHLIPTTA